MQPLANHVAVITGAGNGIGRALARELARKQCDLALVDVNSEALSRTASDLKHFGRNVSLHGVDVAKAAQMEALPQEVLDRHGRVHILVNNAGVSVSGPLHRTRLEDLEWIVGVNLWGAIYGCRAFVPLLRGQSGGHIVNVSSVFGLVGCPTKSAYCATKFAIRGLSEALHAELRSAGIGVTCVHPGAVATEIARVGRSWDEAKREAEAEFLGKRGLAPERVARRIVRAIERNEARVIIGADARLMDWASRLAPGLTLRLLGWLQNRMPFLRE